MARAGSFGGGLNPFGAGSLGGFSQYDIASNLAELEVYKVEVAWGNGTASDDQYLAALTKALGATSPDTRDHESAQNRLDDATYRIGRSKASGKGLDDLIAWDQSAIAKMSTDNLRYRDVKDSLDSEYAQRRSRDYGDLIRRYNNGEISTQKLVDWVGTSLKTISADDPDYKNWTSTRDELAQRLKGEADAKVYQDYQQGRMKGPAFLAYLADRRDSFAHESPEYADWTRKIEDATKQVKSADQAKKDTAFFSSYEEGHKSDKQYLSYLRDRIGGMEPDDPDRASWKHRLTQAAFSLAEDQLRFNVQRGKSPVSKLVTFYKNYQRTLNPGSAEYRTIARNLLTLHAGSGSSGGGGGRRSGGGGSGGGSGGGGGGVSSLGAKGSPKLISPSYTLNNILPLLSVNVNGSKGNVRTATKALDLNIDSLQNARQRGDTVWLFQDPRKPGQLTAGKNPDGSPMLDSKGKAVMVPGSSYLKVSDEAYANLLSIKTGLHYDLAAKALAHHDAAGYYYQLKLATNNEDRIRLVSSQHVDNENRKFYDAAQNGIDLAMRTGDWATAINIAKQLQGGLDSALNNPMLDDTRRDHLQAMADKLAGNPLLPQVVSTDGGKTFQRVGGAIDLDNSSFDSQGNVTAVSLQPGWHFTLDKTDKTGKADWGLSHDDVQDGTWEQNHVIVHTTYGGKVVTGEVERRTAPFNNTMFANTPDGMVRTDVGGQYVTYTDEHGAAVKAYSMDGMTWVRSTTGLAPSLSLNTELKQTSDAQGTHFVDKTTGEIVFTKNPDGSTTKNGAYFDAHPESVDWYGMGDLRKRQANLGRVATTNADGAMKQGQFVSGAEEQYLYSTGRSSLKGKNGIVGGVGGVSVGAPGQAMQVVTMSSSGALNFTGSSDPFGQERDTGARGQAQRPGREDSFAYGSNVSSPNALKKPATKRAPLTGQRKATALGESMADIQPRGPAVNAYTGFVTPSIKSQLPADTPDRYDGVGLKSYTGMPANLKATTPLPNLGGLGARLGAIPPKVKTTRTPLPKAKAPIKKIGFQTPQNTTGRPKPVVKRKPTALKPAVVRSSTQRVAS